MALGIGMLSPMLAFADSDVPILSPTSYNFPPVAVGSSSADQAFTLSNNGSVSLHIIGAQTPAEFPDTSNNCPSDLGVGASCVFNVKFLPAAAGNRSGTLTVFTASGNLIANLSGTGFDPAAPVQFSPTSYDYGTISVGGRGADHAFVLRNFGSMPISVTSASVSAEFTDDGNNCSLPTTLAAGASCFFNVYFSPTASGARSGALTATTGIGNVVANLTGTGGSTDSSPSPISFTPLNNAARSTVVSSNSVTVDGINTVIPVMVSGGTYAINGGAYTDVAGSVADGDTIVVRQTSSASFNTTTTATLTIGSGSDAQSADFTVTTLSADTSPDAFGFGNRNGVAPASTQTSNAITPSGFDDETTISVSGGSYAINGGAFTTSSGSINPGASVAVRVAASNQFATSSSVTLTIGGVTGSFTVTTIAADTTPDAFAFGTIVDVMPSSEQVSNTVTISGVNTNAPISISGGSYSINGGAFTSAAGSIANGDAVTVRQTASPSFFTTTTATLTIGGVSADYQVRTVAAMTDPSAFTFGSVTGVPPSSVQTSGAITVAGTNTASPISVAGGSYAINGGGFTVNAGTVQPGDQVVVRTNASAAFSSTVTVTLTIGATTGTYVVTTLAADTAPDAFDFGSISGVLPDSVQTSETIVVSGINTASPISISSGQYQINDGAYTDIDGMVSAGDHVTVRRQAPAGFGDTAQATVTIGGVSGSFAITTTTADTVPNSFTIPTIEDAAPGSDVNSEVVVIGGTNVPTSYTITNGCLQSSATSSCLASGTLNPGDSFQIVVHSSPEYCQSVSGTANIGGVTSEFTVKTSCDLPEVRVSGGGGSFGGSLLLVLGALGLLRRLLKRGGFTPRRSTALAFAGLLLAGTAPAQAFDTQDIYGGLRLGELNSNLGHTLQAGLRHRGYAGVSSDGGNGSFGGTLYIGYAILPDVDFELGYTHADDPDVRLHGSLSPGTNLGPLLQEAGELASRYGDLYSFAIRMPLPISPRLSIAPRAGVLLIDSDAQVRAGGQHLHVNERSGGYVLASDLRYRIWRALQVGGSINYFRGSHDSHVIEYAALLEWHL